MNGGKGITFLSAGKSFEIYEWAEMVQYAKQHGGGMVMVCTGNNIAVDLSDLCVCLKKEGLTVV